MNVRTATFASLSRRAFRCSRSSAFIRHMSMVMNRTTRLVMIRTQRMRTAIPFLMRSKNFIPDQNKLSCISDADGGTT